MAQQMGLSEEGLRKIETGKTLRIKRRYVQKAAEIFQMTAQDIIEFTPFPLIPSLATSERKGRQTEIGPAPLHDNLAIDNISPESTIQTLLVLLEAERKTTRLLRAELQRYCEGKL